VETITGVLARELGPRGIRVKSINPGLVMTEGIKTTGMHEGEFYEKIKVDTPSVAYALRLDYGAVAVFLASDYSHWIAGEALKVSGGNRPPSNGAICRPSAPQRPHTVFLVSSTPPPNQIVSHRPVETARLFGEFTD
jgi:hypothetical protein